MIQKTSHVSAQPISCETAYYKSQNRKTRVIIKDTGRAAKSKGAEDCMEGFVITAMEKLLLKFLSFWVFSLFVCSKQM